MATARSQEVICRLVKYGTLELETEAGRKPDYNGVVVREDTLLVIDGNAWNLQLYSRHDGKLLSTSHRLESDPMGVCLISKTEVDVCLLNCKIVIQSFKSVDDVKMVKTLDIRAGFDRCHSVAKLNSDKLVVSGWKKFGRMLCWGVVSITDGRLDSTHNICKGEWSHLAIKGNTVYISCRTYNSTTNGVYAFDIFNPYTHKFIYQHQELKDPGWIMAERDCVYVCDLDSNGIHQLTDSGQLVTIHTVSSRPYGVFYDDQHGVLYTTSMDSNLITVYRMEYSHQTGIPTEILKMDDRSIQLFEEALKDGKETVYSIRIMVVGHMGVGKTTLVKRLLGQEVQISERHSTEGIDVYVNCCDVSLSTYEWTRRTKDSGQDYRLQRIARVLHEQHSMKDKVVDKEHSLSTPHGEKSLESLDRNLVAVENKDTKVLYHHSAQQDIGQDLSPTAIQQDIHQDLSSTTSQQDIGQDLSSTTSLQDVGQDLSSTASLQDIGQDLSSTTSQQDIGQDLSPTTIQQDIHQDLSSTTSQQDIGQDLSSTTSQQDIGQDLSSTTSQQDIGQDLSSTVIQQDIGQDLSSTTSQQYIGQDLSSTTSQQDIGQDLSSTTSQQDIGQDLSSTTSQQDIGQDLSSTASQQDIGQDLSSTTSQHDIGQDHSSTTSQQDIGQDLSSTTSHQDIGQDLSSTVIQQDIGQDHSSTTSQQDIGQDLSSTTSQQDIGQDLSSTTSQQDIGQDLSSTTSQQDIGQDLSSTTSQQDIGQDLSSTASQQDIGQDLSSTTSQHDIGQDLSSTTSQQDIGQDFSSTASQQDIHQDLSFSTSQHDIGQDLSSISSQQDIGQDLSSTVIQQDIGQDLSSTTSQQVIGQDLSSTTSQQDIGQDLSSTTSQQDIGQDLSSTTSQQDIGQDLSSTASQQDIGQDLSSTTSQHDISQDLSSTTSQHDIGQELLSTTSQHNLGQDLSSTVSQQEGSPSPVVQMKSTKSKTNTIAMLKLLKENVNKLETTGKTSLMTIWDFAGQYAFYTTHQTFLTRRAIYLLVSDVSGHVTDLVADECYFDSKGIMKCKVHELIEVWLNSIHTSAPSHDASNPPVILVGTHVDKILQKLTPVKGKDSETQITASEAVEFNLPTTSIHAATATNERPRALTIIGAVKKFVQSQKTEGIVEVAPVSKMTDQQRKWSWLPWKKKKMKTEEPVGETIVGVDAEKGNHHEICERYFREIRSYLKDKPTRFHLIDEDFAIDNTVVDSKLEDLKRKIVEVASQQPYWGEEIPARWLLLEQELMRRKAAGVKVISREDVDKINKDFTVHIEKSEEMDLFLRFLHETGTIIYFSIEVLRENIVLDPMWLIDALKSLINAQLELPESSADNDTQSSSPADIVVTQKWSDFKGKGILSSDLIDAVWTKEKYPELHSHKDHMLLIMEQLNIIAKPRSFSEIGEKVESYFLTPCMLRQESPREIISPEQDTQMVSTPFLCYIFTGNFLPPPIFHRLIAACIARWPVAKKKETSENLIFCGCCVFDLGLFHRLTLHSKNHIVFARITRIMVDEDKTPDAKLCTRVRKFITLNLSKITSYLGQNLQFELRTQYLPSQGVTEDGMAAFSPPFQMWLAEEGHDPDAPIMPEHMSHARLCVALVTVCGNALREILLTHVPEPHTNIYQAIRAKKANLTNKTQTRRGQWQNALLIPDQCQVVFPDPFGRYVASVDQFDISLLYILIRNVSTVPAPLLGWELDTIDHPRERSLGASVARIRSYRNQIGHSMDGKISQQDFDDYWNKIDAVLDDIEHALGRQEYRAQLEKQKRQVISVYEAC